MSERNVHAILFDVGGVLINSHPDAAACARILGMETDEESVSLVDHAIWAHRDEYDAGLSDQEFWDRIAGDCGLPELSDTIINQLVELDTSRIEKDVDLRAVNVVRSLHKAGFTTGILSNAPCPIASAVRAASWAQGIFDVMVFSADTGVPKPDRAIYKAAVEAVGREATDILFIDDRAKNLKGAELLGMQTFRWTSTDQAIAGLSADGFPVTK